MTSLYSLSFQYKVSDCIHQYEQLILSQYVYLWNRVCIVIYGHMQCFYCIIDKIIVWIIFLHQTEQFEKRTWKKTICAVTCDLLWLLSKCYLRSRLVLDLHNNIGSKKEQNESVIWQKKLCLWKTKITIPLWPTFHPSLEDKAPCGPVGVSNCMDNEMNSVSTAFAFQTPLFQVQFFSGKMRD